MTLRTLFCAFGIVASVGLAGNYTGALAQGLRTCAALKGIDINNDGTADLAEAKQAATEMFDKLDKNKDGTLSPEELKGRLSRAEFKAADKDKDGTLSKDEYLAIVEARFKAADVNADGTVDCGEANSKAGRALLRLLK